MIAAIILAILAGLIAAGLIIAGFLIGYPLEDEAAKTGARFQRPGAPPVPETGPQGIKNIFTHQKIILIPFRAHRETMAPLVQLESLHQDVRQRRHQDPLPNLQRRLRRRHRLRGGRERNVDLQQGRVVPRERGLVRLDGLHRVQRDVRARE